MKLSFCIFLITITIIISSCDSSIAVLSYNVGGLFDDVDDGTEYREFDPGEGNWTENDFEGKLTAIEEVVRRSHPGGPAVVAFQEIENRRALDILCEEHLPEYPFRMIVQAPDQAIHCAIISRYPIVRTRTLDTGSFGSRKQRYILEAEINVEGNSLILFNNHWKSKSGGIAETASGRRKSAIVLVHRLQSLLRGDPAADILIVGDFNENVNEGFQNPGLTALSSKASTESGGSRLFLTGSVHQTGVKGDGLVLYDPWFELPDKNRGSYVYRRDWQTPDHILLTPGLFDLRGFRYVKGDYRVVDLPFIVDSDTGFPRIDAPGRRRYSDHLPLLILLQSED